MPLVDVFATFFMMFSAKAAKDGVNPLRDKVGQVVADERLRILDSPLQSSGFGYGPDAARSVCCGGDQRLRGLNAVFRGRLSGRIERLREQAKQVPAGTALERVVPAGGDFI